MKNATLPHFYVVIGTRAQTIKMAPVLLEFEKNNISFTLMYTQQHKETIGDLLDNFNIKIKPINIIEVSQEAKTKMLFVVWFIKFVSLIFNPFKSKQFFREKRSVIVTHGDTATTFLAALWAKIYKHKVMHIESGMRSFNYFNPFPEELFRVGTFYLTDYFICPKEYNLKNLEKFKGEKVLLGENTMYDSLQIGLKNVSEENIKNVKEKLALPDEKFVLVSIHRYENIFKLSELQNIINILKDISRKFKLVFILHPSTKKQLIRRGYYNELVDNKNFQLIDRQDFLTFVVITKLAEFMITDGGSNQEEMSYIGKPTILFRKFTEHQVGLGKNILLSKLNRELINEFVDNYKSYQRSGVKLSVSPSQKIVNFIKTKKWNFQ